VDGGGQQSRASARIVVVVVVICLVVVVSTVAAFALLGFDASGEFRNHLSADSPRMKEEILSFLFVQKKLQRSVFITGVFLVS
jgi:hypothetical protein